MQLQSPTILLKRTIWLTGSGVLAFASYWSVRLAVADFYYREDTISSLSRAVDLAQGDAEYRALFAEHLEGAGTDPDPLFRSAAALSPQDSRYWIRLGFSAESKGMYNKAEQYLLQAASVNRKFDPAWALMNFYFRRGQTDQFWIWADRAMAMSYGDLSGLYRLFWSMSDDAKLIRSHVPSKPVALAAYLQFLESAQPGTNLAAAAAGAARDLADIAGPEQTPYLLAYCSRALDPNTRLSDETAATTVWNTLSRRRLLPVPLLDPSKGVVIGDPEFTLYSGPGGFAWHTLSNDEIAIDAAYDSHGVHISFSGQEPQEVVLLETVAPVAVGVRYRILCDVEYDQSAGIAGLAWEITTAALPERVSAAAPVTPEGCALEFNSAVSPVLLRLHYRRPTGSTLGRGGLTVRSVRSEVAP